MAFSSWQDLRIGFRNLVRQPGMSSMIVGMLALGVAGATSMFSLFNGLFLRPLPLTEPERLIDIDEEAPKWNLEYVAVAPPDFAAWRAHNKTFTGMAAYDGASANMSGFGDAERVEGARVTHDFLTVLGLKPVIGRDFLKEEDRPGGPKVVLMGYGLWQRKFGGQNKVLGTVLRLNGEPYTVVGVAPKEAVLPGRAELFWPIQLNPRDGNGWWMNAIGRLKPGVTIEQARQDLLRVHKNQIAQRKVNEITFPKIQPLRERALGNYRTSVTVMLGAVGVVLLIACVNIAGLMLARGTARFREMGIRSALGATRSRMAGQLLIESLVLAVVGAAFGVLMGMVATNALVALMPENHLPVWVVFTVDWRFLGFTVAVTAAAAVLFGLWPALESSRVDVFEALQESAKGSSSAGRKRSLSLMVAGEVSLAVILLVGAGLLLQAFRKLQEVNPGYRTQNILTYRVGLPDKTYEKSEQKIAFFSNLLDKVRAIPGVTSAGASTAPPLMGHWGMFYEVEKSTAPPAGKEAQDPVVLTRVVTPGYFETMGIRLVEGRWFTDHEALGTGLRTAVVNETFAKRFWPGASAVGQRFKNRGGKEWVTVVGVAGDIKHYGLEGTVRPGVYAPLGMIPRDSLVIVVRAAVDAVSLVNANREALRQLDPEVPMYSVRTMQDRMDESNWMRRTYSWLLWAFSVIALVLATGGIYGVISYSVGRRTREIGIRMALGAQQGQVVGEVLRQGLLLGAAGLVVGLGIAYLCARYMGTMLFGVNPRDPWVYCAVAGVLMLVALLANFAPARRAAGVNPMTALRME